MFDEALGDAGGKLLRESDKEMLGLTLGPALGVAVEDEGALGDADGELLDEADEELFGLALGPAHGVAVGDEVSPSVSPTVGDEEVFGDANTNCHPNPYLLHMRSTHFTNFFTVFFGVHQYN